MNELPANTDQAEESKREQFLREQMAREQIEERGIQNAKLLAVMRAVPRHCFLPANLQRFAYQDGPLPIGHGQTISQPYIVALMTDLLDLDGTQRVLEVGTGSGYQAAILSRLANEVHTIERHPSLAQNAAQILAGLGYNNVTVHCGDGSIGYPPAAPYDAILVAAAAPSACPELLAQLNEGGRLVIPVGNCLRQELQRWTRKGKDYERRDILAVSFVPLRGKNGWSDESWQANCR